MATRSTRRAVLMGFALVVAGAAFATWLVWKSVVAQSPSISASAAPVSMNDPLDQFNLTGLLVPRSEILSGGPPKDGIPSLTKPTTMPVSGREFLRNDDRVIAVTIDSQTRGYPVAILNWHEAINDELGSVPIAVNYCPLCDSVSVVDRRIDGKTMEFGISGLLHNSNVLFYDRTDNALWSQVGLRAISGPNAGKSLRHLPWEIVSFATFRQRHPRATIVTTQTGYGRDYSANPYASYFATDRLMFPVAHRDDRLGAKAPVVGVRVGESTRAYPVQSILGAPNRTITDQIDGRRVVLQADEAGGITVVEAPAEAQVVHSFWFAWAAFHPKTGLYGKDQPTTSADQTRLAPR